MAEPAISAQLPNDLLTRKLLRKASAGDRPLALLLEHLCTDSLYSLKDDFDRGIDPILWTTRGFKWEENDLQGGISTLRDSDVVAEDESGSDSYLASRTFGWRGERRPVIFARLRAGLGRKFEFGFSDQVVNTGFGVVTNKSTPLASSGGVDFTLACYDGDHNTSIDIVADGSNDSIARSSAATVITPRGSETFSIMLSLNEQRESMLWLNGVYTAVLRTGPRAKANMCIWLRTDDLLYLDFIQAWQERVAI